jgi:hypothetical protein
MGLSAGAAECSLAAAAAPRALRFDPFFSATVRARVEKGVEHAHPRAPRRRPAGARICCDKFRRIRRAQSSGSRRVATEFK